MILSDSTRWTYIRRAGGAAIVVLALWYLYQSLSNQFGAIAPLLRGDPSLWYGVAALSPIYAASLGFLAGAWVLFLPRREANEHSRALLYVYVATSIGKYFPGGIFHFGGRQALGAQLGLSHRSLLSASAYETLASVVAALLLGAILLWTPSVVIAIGATVLLCAVTAIGARIHQPLRRQLTAFSMALVFMLVMAALAVAFSFLLGIGAWSIGGAYLIAWSVGLITPGVSAGIGVREAALVFLLTGAVAPAEIAVLAIMMRFVTTAGDGLFFLFSYRLKATGPFWKGNN